MIRKGQTQTLNASAPDNAPTAVPGQCVVAILEVHNADPLSGYPANVNVAEAFTYKVESQTPNGRIVRDGVRPIGRRWPPPWLVEAHTVNPGGSRPIFYDAAMLSGKLWLLDKEERWAAPCSFTPGGA